MRVCRLVAACLGAALLLAPAAQAGYFDVGSLPLPAPTGQEIASDLEGFATTYAPRVTGTPGDAAAAEFLRSEAEKLGYKTEITTLPVADPSEPQTVLRAVHAWRDGVSQPNEHIIFTGHYDTVAGYGGATLNGTYDNGSGTTMIRALSKAFAKTPTNRSIDFIWYDGEEEGLLASQRHAQAWKDTGKAVRAVLGFDMVGIAWPVAAPGPRSCLCMWHGGDDEDLLPLLEHVNYDVLHYPQADNLVYVVGANERNSDESSWDNLGYRTLRWAGMRAASDYPAYHMPNDTMDEIATVAGGRQYFEQGLRNTLLSSYYTALSLDNEMPVAVAAAAGSRPVSFNAAGSSDPDGPIGAYEWDFGDGAKGTGAALTHIYKKAGDYTATLTVHDNLWPQVTSKATVSVHASGPPKKRKHAKKRKAKRKAPRVVGGGSA